MVATAEGGEKMVVEKRFPFLIGMVATELPHLINYLHNMFPFLIGMVATKKYVIYTSEFEKSFHSS